MNTNALFYPMFAHVLWVVFLCGLLTIFRAPTFWNIGNRDDGSNPWESLEPKVSANFKNQCEWPIWFYVICVVLMVKGAPVDASQVLLAWVFVVGRVLHSGVQILSSNIRARGVVFTLNFAAVLMMWFLYWLNIS